MVRCELRIAEATVKAHVKALLHKMQVTNCTLAVIKALQVSRLAEGEAKTPPTSPVATSLPGLEECPAGE